MRVLKPAMVLAVMCASAVAYADTVVVSSTSPGIAPGTVFQSGATLDIPAGAAVTFVSQSGQSFTLTGPYTGAPQSVSSASEDGNLVQSLSRLLSKDAKDATALGVMRSGIIKAKPPAHAIRTGRTGVYCIDQKGALYLWRAKYKQAATLTIKNRKSRQSVKVFWSAGEAEKAWPQALPVEDRATFVARYDNHPSAAKITLRILPTSLPTKYHRAAWMHDQGCSAQARDVLNSE